MTAADLPPGAYTSSEVFAWEMDRFFERGWVFLGHGDELAAAGDQKAFSIGRESVLVIRDRQGRLNGVYNTCRHRGHELLAPRTTRNLGAIKCPYHAWVYGLDGSLRAAPLFGEVEGFERSEYSLVPVNLEQWSGSLFVNASGDAGPLQDAVTDLEGLVSPDVMQGASVGHTSEQEIDANWKTVIVDRLLSNQPGQEDVETYHLGLFPGQLLGLHPEYVATYRIEPLEPGRTRVERRVLATLPARGASPTTGVRHDPGEFIARVAGAYLAGREAAD